MASKGKNSNLGAARTAKKDEFYTQLPNIERELKHYKAQFKAKVVYCNCDDPAVSQFFHYFSYNFEHLGLKIRQHTYSQNVVFALLRRLPPGRLFVTLKP
jgi:hypothetical protein